MTETSCDYAHAVYPRESLEIRRHVEAAARRLGTKVNSLQLPRVSASPFIRTYLQSIMEHYQAAMQRYSLLFAWSLHTRTAGDLRDVTLVDYGGGSGILALLAREMGIGTVIYVDIYDVCCRDARRIGTLLGLPADHYVHADSDGLVAYLQARKLACNTVMSYDTLEHIYDIDKCFDDLRRVSPGPLTVTLASGANPLNPLINRRLMRLQRRVEIRGKVRKEGEDERNPELPLISIRENIIREAFKDMDPRTLHVLARRTRGKNQADIVRAVAAFRNDGVLPPEMNHPTNTCDPQTGNWCERLLDPYVVGDKLEQMGFRTDVFPGYYGSVIQDGVAKRSLRSMANALIARSARAGLHLAPYYCINAVRQ